MIFLDGDSLIFIDFRADRMRQIVEAFGIKPQFETDKIPKDIVSDNWEFVPIFCHSRTDLKIIFLFF